MLLCIFQHERFRRVYRNKRMITHEITETEFSKIWSVKTKLKLIYWLDKVPTVYTYTLLVQHDAIIMQGMYDAIYISLRHTVINTQVQTRFLCLNSEKFVCIVHHLFLSIVRGSWYCALYISISLKDIQVVTRS